MKKYELTKIIREEVQNMFDTQKNVNTSSQQVNKNQTTPNTQQPVKQGQVNTNQQQTQNTGNQKQTADITAVINSIEKNTALKQLLLRIDTNAELLQFLEYILNKINPKISGINVQSLINVINKKFNARRP